MLQTIDNGGESKIMGIKDFWKNVSTTLVIICKSNEMQTPTEFNMLLGMSCM